MSSKNNINLSVSCWAFSLEALQGLGEKFPSSPALEGESTQQAWTQNRRRAGGRHGTGEQKARDSSTGQAQPQFAPSCFIYSRSRGCGRFQGLEISVWASGTLSDSHQGDDDWRREILTF